VAHSACADLNKQKGDSISEQSQQVSQDSNNQNRQQLSRFVLHSGVSGVGEGRK